MIKQFYMLAFWIITPKHSILQKQSFELILYVVFCHLFSTNISACTFLYHSVSEQKISFCVKALALLFSVNRRSSCHFHQLCFACECPDREFIFSRVFHRTIRQLLFHTYYCKKSPGAVFCLLKETLDMLLQQIAQHPDPNSLVNTLVPLVAKGYFIFK